MEKYTWIISINSQYLTPAKLFKFQGTVEEAKQKLYAIYLEDHEEEIRDMEEIDEEPADVTPIEDMEYKEEEMKISFAGTFHDVGEYQDELYPIEYQAIELEHIALA